MSENPIMNMILACAIALVLLFFTLMFSVIAQRYSKYERRSDSYGNTWDALVDQGPVGGCASCLGTLTGIMLAFVILAILFYAFVGAGRFVVANWGSIVRILSVVGMLLASLVLIAVGVAVMWGIIKFAIAFIDDLFHPERYN